MPDFESSLELCTYCPRLCSHTCPVSLTSGRETLTPQSKMARAALLQPPAPGMAGQVEWSSLPLYGCTGCGACTDACLHQVEPASALMRARGESESSEHGHPSLRDLPERHRRRAQSAAASLSNQPALAARRAAAGSVAFLPACLPRGPIADGPATEATMALRLFDRLSAATSSFTAPGLAVVDAPGGCAGYPLYAAGYVESFRLYAESFARAIEGYQALALSCSACTWLLRRQFPSFGVPVRPQILHLSELLAPHSESLPVTRRLATATYQDPCHLGRRLGCFEPPRQLLRRAVDQLDELAQHHEQSRCCGSGGLLPLTDPSLARAMALECQSDLPAATSTGPLVSGCPACQHHQEKSGGVPTITLLRLLDDATTPG